MKTKFMNIIDFQKYVAENMKAHLPEKDRDVEITTVIVDKL